MKYLVSLSAVCLLLGMSVQAAGPDTATRELIEQLRLDEAEQPVRESPGWKRPERIVVMIPGSLNDMRAELLASFERVSDGIEIVTVSGREFTGEEGVTLAEAQVILGFCSPQLIRTAKNLHWLQHFGTGVDRCLLSPEAQDADFILTNAQHTAGPPIAEHVIAMLMMLTRNLQYFHHLQQEQVWQRPPDTPSPMIEIGGKTMLVAGLGGIGTEVARRAAGLGMRVIATRRSSREGPGFVDYVGLSDELLDLAAQADVIVNALPLTRETTGIFGREFFDALKQGAYFISIGRGKSTDTAELIAALKSGRLAGAGLDVTDPEPLTKGHELWSLPNVIITPHISYMTDRGIERNILVITENLRRYINGERMMNVVDIDRGY
ncbi:MAG: D-2-hydroxyacid dehydrogenase [Gammaproteobacteria bacterium]|nr:D-2-hydroxyacid dehydrogenase [Gammaproteobacteria bacterium]MDE0512166.1 D-2-hydroxyacid dehydrogenase [Gammaproteobacteria bacterium]